MDTSNDSRQFGETQSSRVNIGNGCWHHAKKNEIKPWQAKQWCIPKVGTEFVAAMEDVLEVYQRPYDKEYPVFCLDECSRQLIEQVREVFRLRKVQ